jgi:hypothetical protein
MDLSEARGLVLFRVVREGIGITQRLVPAALERLQALRILTLEPERLQNPIGHHQDADRRWKGLYTRDAQAACDFSLSASKLSPFFHRVQRNGCNLARQRETDHGGLDAFGQRSLVEILKRHLQQWRDWTLVDDGIFFFRQRSAPKSVLSFFDFATARVRDVTTLEKPGEWISASVDGKFVLYHQLDHEESNIMLLENFR